MTVDSEFLLLALGALATILNPLGIISQFLVFSAGAGDDERRGIARRGVLAAGAVLIVVSIAGTAVFRLFGVSLPAFRIAGGILLFLIALDMLFARRASTRITPAEHEASIEKEDVAIFPVAIPLIAGPGSITTVLILGQEAETWAEHGALLLLLCAILFGLYVVLAQANRIEKRLGVIGMNVVVRLMGLILAAIAVQFVLDGVFEALRV